MSDATNAAEAKVLSEKLLKLIQGDNPAIVAEVRNQKSEERTWLDAATGKVKPYTSHTLSLESTRSEQFKAYVSVPDDVKVLPHFAKGSRIAMSLRGWETGKGGRIARVNLADIVQL